MKYLIFAGGSGTRFWPLSRKNEPKQFLKIFNGKSTFELAVERAFKNCNADDIRICTHFSYKDKVLEQGKKYGMTEKNLYLEPARKNLGPAIAYAMVRLKKEGYNGNLMMMWADHIINDVKGFFEALRFADEVINLKKAECVLVGRKPSFANFNFGWMKMGDKITIKKDQKIKTYKYEDFIYRPQPIKCEKMFEKGEWLWNTGYYAISMDYLEYILKTYNKDLYKKIDKIARLLGRKGAETKITNIYESIEPIHSDNAILYNTDKSKVSIVEAKFDWEDPGTLYAYKKYYELTDRNFIKGEGKLYKTEDSMIYNETKDKIVGFGLDGIIIVRMKDVIYVLHKDKSIETSQMLDEMKLNGYHDIV